MNNAILLKNRPSGTPSLEDFSIVEEEQPEVSEGEVLLKSRYVSVDPYLRGRMRNEESYIPPFELNKPMESMVIAEVVESRNHHFRKGEFVSGMLKWKLFQICNGRGLNKVDPEQAPLSAYLGILGLTGLTAYLGLDKIGKPQEGETLVVSGAAGAVGSIVGQIGKIRGCRVVGTAGSDEKISHIKDKFGFDAGINYNSAGDLAAALKEVCPNGVDVYFDNVGGEMLDAVMANVNKNARIINCGAISLYNETDIPTGPRLEGILIKKTVLMQGFLVRDHAKDFGPAINQLATWLREGSIRYDETIVEGFENIPQAFLDLFEGKNKGKMVVKV